MSALSRLAIAAAAFPDLASGVNVIPKDLTVKGKPVDAARWTDRLGLNLVVLTESERVGEASGGTKNIYVQTSNPNISSQGNTAADLAAATSGTLFLSAGADLFNTNPAVTGAGGPATTTLEAVIPANSTLQLPHAGLTSVARNHVAQGRIGEAELLCCQSRGL